METVELEVPVPLRDCFLHSETICVRECCGIDAISQEPTRVTDWSRKEGHQAVLKALGQIKELTAQVQDRSRKVVVPFLNALADGEVTREKLLSFLQAFEVALRDCPVHEMAAANEMLTVKEIKERFDAEWVLLGDPELTEDLQVVRGRVLCHSADRDEVYRKAVELRPKHSAYLYTGRVPENTVIML